MFDQAVFPFCTALRCGSFTCMYGFVPLTSLTYLRMWSYQTLNKTAEFVGFIDFLESEIARRGLSGSENEILAERDRGPA